MEQRPQIKTDPTGAPRGFTTGFANRKRQLLSRLKTADVPVLFCSLALATFLSVPRTFHKRACSLLKFAVNQKPNHAREKVAEG
jgi:hypothetical protein